MDQATTTQTRRESLLEMVEATNKSSRIPIKHAWVNIDKARKLVNLDNEMACFRAITAEEEAATGIFQALKNIGYQKADKLNKNFHNHKAGLWHLLTIMSAFMDEVGFADLFDTKIDFDTRSKNKLIIRLAPKNEKFIGHFVIDPPLQMNISQIGGTTVDFIRQAEQLASLNNKKDLQQFIKAEANFRNELLYCNHNGFPAMTGDVSGFIDEREKRIVGFTYAYLMIAQHPRKKQNFVQLALDAYVKLLGIK